MGSFSIWHWLVVLVIVVLIFGTSKLKNMGKDLGGAVKGFKEGMKEAEAEAKSETKKETPQVAEKKAEDVVDVKATEKKTAGSLMGKAQRFVSQVKTDIDKEIELSELKKIQEDAKKMASELQDNLRNTQNQIEKEVSDLNSAVNTIGKSMEEQAKGAASQINEVVKNEVKNQWLSDTAPKAADAAEASIENMVEAPVAEKETVWDIAPDKIDTSNLEGAFAWYDADSSQSSVSVPIPAPLTEEEPLIGTSSSVDFNSIAESEKIAALSKEVEELKALVMANASGSKKQIRSVKRSRVNKRATAAKLNRIHKTRSRYS